MLKLVVFNALLVFCCGYAFLRGGAPERIAAILDALRQTYPNVVCALNHRSAFELVVATALSAQTTDVRVNSVTPELFDRYPTPEALAAAPIPELERILHPVGFFRAKSKNIKGLAQKLGA